MVSNKLPNKESTDKLLDLLEKNKVKDKVNRDGTVSSFISVFNIKPGEQKVSSKDLYQLYTKWTKNKLTYRCFNKEIKRYFEYELKTINKIPHLLINLHTINVNFKIIPPKTKTQIYTNHFDNYLKFYNITSGTFWIEEYILYYLYDKWTYKNNNKHPLGPVQFDNFCNLYFKSKLSSHYKYFSVNKNILNHLTQEHLQQLRERRNEKTKKESKQKKF